MKRIIGVCTVLLTMVMVGAYANDYASKKGLKGYHISSLINHWGDPYSVKGRKYTWKDCTYTGYVITNCQYGNCRSHQETTCCYQILTTDKDGIITNYSERGQGYCFNPVNYNRLTQDKRYADKMYGTLGFVEGANGFASYTYSIDANKTSANNYVNNGCQGKCTKTIDFDNACVAIAVPKSTKQGQRKMSDLFYDVDKNGDKSLQKATKNCEKQHGKGQCQPLVAWGDNSTHICTSTFR